MSDNKPVINTNAPAPPGVQGEGFFAGKLSDIIGMARSFSLLLILRFKSNFGQ
jgi:NADH-quinone oxidoreductase subunit B